MQIGSIKDIFDHTDCLCIHQTIIKQGGFTYFPQCRAPNICCSRSSSPPPPFRFLFSLSIAMCRPYFVIFTHPHFRLAALWSIKKFQDVFFVIGLSKKTSVKAKLHWFFCSFVCLGGFFRGSDIVRFHHAQVLLEQYSALRLRRRYCELSSQQRCSSNVFSENQSYFSWELSSRSVQYGLECGQYTTWTSGSSG